MTLDVTLEEDYASAARWRVRASLVIDAGGLNRLAVDARGLDEQKPRYRIEASAIARGRSPRVLLVARSDTLPVGDPSAGGRRKRQPSEVVIDGRPFGG